MGSGELQAAGAIRLSRVVGRGCDDSGAGAQPGGVSQAIGGAAGFAVKPSDVLVAGSQLVSVLACGPMSGDFLKPSGRQYLARLEGESHA
jgi:hypothetical protein